MKGGAEKRSANANDFFCPTAEEADSLALLLLGSKPNLAFDVWKRHSTPLRAFRLGAYDGHGRGKERTFTVEAMRSNPALARAVAKTIGKRLSRSLSSEGALEWSKGFHPVVSALLSGKIKGKDSTRVLKSLLTTTENSKRQISVQTVSQLVSLALIRGRSAEALMLAKFMVSRPDPSFVHGPWQSGNVSFGGMSFSGERHSTGEWVGLVVDGAIKLAQNGSAPDKASAEAGRIINGGVSPWIPLFKAMEAEKRGDAMWTGKGDDLNAVLAEFERIRPPVPSAAVSLAAGLGERCFAAVCSSLDLTRKAEAFRHKSFVTKGGQPSTPEEKGAYEAEFATEWEKMKPGKVDCGENDAMFAALFDGIRADDAVRFGRVAERCEKLGLLPKDWTPWGARHGMRQTMLHWALAVGAKGLAKEWLTAAPNSSGGVAEMALVLERNQRVGVFTIRDKMFGGSVCVMPQAVPAGAAEVFCFDPSGYGSQRIELSGNGRDAWVEGNFDWLSLCVLTGAVDLAELAAKKTRGVEKACERVEKTLESLMGKVDGTAMGAMVAAAQTAVLSKASSRSRAAKEVVGTRRAPKV